jgi:hypothetical protein
LDRQRVKGKGNSTHYNVSVKKKKKNTKNILKHYFLWRWSGEELSMICGFSLFAWVLEHIPCKK